MINHLLYFLVNDLLLLLGKKLHDRYFESSCVSGCCRGTSSCLMRYVESGKPKKDLHQQPLYTREQSTLTGRSAPD